MKRLFILCEGHTEKEFCENILLYHLMQFKVSVNSQLLPGSNGGLINWDKLKNHIKQYLYEDAFVTTFIDFYGIQSKHRFPKWTDIDGIQNPYEKVNMIENGMKNEVKKIKNNSNNLFIPYIQLHEFECLLFSDVRVFKSRFEDNHLQKESQMMEILKDFDNDPELINNGKETAPSKRIEKIYNDYKKVDDGSLLTMEIGLKTIREKCKKFNTWIEQLEQI